VLAETGSSEAERIDLAYRLCTGRNATADESESVQRFLKIQRDRIESGGLNAEEIIATQPPQGIDQNEAAAWVITARVLLNLDETLNKN
jgi:hypothetical protein